MSKLPKEMTENELAKVVIDISFQIHRKWGPGLLESAYEALLVHRLRRRGFSVEQQKPIPFYDEGVKLEVGFRADVIVENKLLLELKSITKLNNSIPKTVRTYLVLTDLKLGLIINFGEEFLKDGLKRVINGFLDD